MTVGTVVVFHSTRVSRCLFCRSRGPVARRLRETVPVRDESYSPSCERVIRSPMAVRAATSTELASPAAVPWRFLQAVEALASPISPLW